MNKSFHTLGEIMQLARARKKHTQDQAAEDIDVAKRSWCSWETGEARPATNHILVLAKYCQIEPVDLLRLARSSSQSQNTKETP